MSTNNNKQQTPTPEEVQSRLDIISQANETSVLMAVLMEKLGLPQRTTTHQQFIEAFTTLQKNRLDAEKYMQEQFMLGQQIKTRKTRTKKEFEETVGRELNLNDDSIELEEIE